MPILQALDVLIRDRKELKLKIAVDDKALSVKNSTDFLWQ